MGRKCLLRKIQGVKVFEKLKIFFNSFLTVEGIVIKFHYRSLPNRDTLNVKRRGFSFNQWRRCDTHSGNFFKKNSTPLIKIKISEFFIYSVYFQEKMSLATFSYLTPLCHNLKINNFLMRMLNTANYN